MANELLFVAFACHSDEYTNNTKKRKEKKADERNFGNSMNEKEKKILHSRWLIQTQCSSVIIEYNDRCRPQFDIHINERKALSRVNNNLFNFFFVLNFFK